MERTDVIDRLDFFKGLAIIYTVGLVGHGISLFRELMFFLTPFVLLISGVIVLVPAIRAKNFKVILWIAMGSVATFFIEVAGVKTGLIFGPYNYGPVLGFCLLDVPIVIGLNWMIIIYGSVCLGEILFRSRVLAALFASLIPVIMDIIIEPVAIALDYWSWQDGIIPLQNYAAWWVISLVFAAVYNLLRPKTHFRLPIFYLGILFVYFLVLNVYVWVGLM